MSRRGFTFVELLVALVLLAVALLGLLAAMSQAARAERGNLRARSDRARAIDAHERGVRPAPPGWTLTELLVALVLGAVLLAAAGSAVQGVGVRRAGRGLETRAALRRLDEAADLLAAAVREGVTPRLEGDSVLVVERILGLTIGCAPGVVGRPVGDWRATPRAGDRWRIWRGPPGWEDGRATGGRATACPAGQLGWRPDGAPLIGVADLALVTRLIRWTRYRDAEGRVQLGLRESQSAGWDAVQPVVGPFDALRLSLAPHDTGWTLVVGADIAASPREARRLVHPRNP